MIGVLLLLVGFTAFAADAVSGDAVYKKRCAQCHDTGGDRIPSRAVLTQMRATRILRALDAGAMMTVAYPMNRAERDAVAKFLGKPGPEPPPPAAAFCKDRRIDLNGSAAPSWNGWSPLSDNARYQPAEAARLTLDQVANLKLKWAYGFDGDVNAYAAPAVVGGHVFIGSAGGVVQALRADSGCLEWTFQAEGAVRSGMAIGPMGARHAVVFGDLMGWAYALEAETGKLLWKKRPEEHEAARITSTPLIVDGTAYMGVASWEETRATNPEYACCTFRGSVIALKIRDGSVVWKTYTIPNEPKQSGRNSAGTARMGPSGAGIWSAPTLDRKRNLLYVATGDNYSTPTTSMSDSILALDLATGQIRWAKQTVPNDAFNSACGVKGVNCPDEAGPDFDFGSSPILVGDLILAGQKSGIVYALDPEKQGAIVWQTRVGKGGTLGGVQWGMATDSQRVYAASSDARFTASASARVLDVKEGGGLTALRITDGSTAWNMPPIPCKVADHCSPAQSAAVTAIPGAVFSGSVDGHLRAYSAEDGKILWDVDTAKPYKTVNGVAAKGGSIDGPGAVVVGGMVFVNSGYSRYGGRPGNVLLVFGP
jgi:polyvinyl alcohol dehydrogenase (cytochrome)